MNILELNNTEARAFFLKEESYFNFDLPSYFTFEQLLNDLSASIQENEIETLYQNINPGNGNPQRPFPAELEKVNYVLLNNKDGKYSWRPYQLIHPAIYVALVHKITDADNWQLIKDRFTQFQANENIICHSIPLQSEDENSDTATSIINWWNEIEQKSIELSLSYEYVMHTDIADCYGSIYTHSIPWAAHTKPFAKQNRGYQHVGNKIDKLLRDMSFGQTNGIPQGSSLMDFIAEMVLGYADLLLSEKLAEKDITEYKILRFRDDYRIFTNNPQTSEEITKYLTEILIDLGMRLNAQKTFISNNVVIDSIKPDKLYWNSVKKSTSSLQGHLLLLHDLASKYSNSGSLRKALDRFFHRLNIVEETDENINVLTSIIMDIAFKNPRTYPVCCAILSKLLSLTTEEENQRLLELINTKFEKIPNTSHIKIWLQRVTIKSDRNIPYNETLCDKVNDPTVQIWNSDWLNNDIKDIIENSSIIDENEINKIDIIIDSEEFQLFEY
ncbi:RNA-directed DNA polymerase [Croceimicrobium sp.]|uniref:RNA-directed DNA polymerase n=1 Tax=Croceimicrobium sp. TaxID=2828340 RepID=UPI003BA9A8B2